MNWRDVAAKFRKAPKALLSAAGVPDDASDSEMVSAIFRKIPELKNQAGIDDSGLEDDYKLWNDLRAKRAIAGALNKDAGEQDVATRKGVQALSELGSYPLNEGLRRGGYIGPDETLGDVASDVAGGGTGGAVASAATSVLTDPLTFVGAGAASRLTKAAATSPVVKGAVKLLGPRVAKAIPAVVGAGAVAVPYAKVVQIGQEKGYNSPEFKAALAGTTAAIATAVAASNPRAAFEMARGAFAGKPRLVDAPPAVNLEPGVPRGPVEIPRPAQGPNPAPFNAVSDATARALDEASRFRANADDPFAAAAAARLARDRAAAFGFPAEDPGAARALVADPAPFQEPPPVVQTPSTAGAMAPLTLRPQDLEALKNAEAYAAMRRERTGTGLADLENTFSGPDYEQYLLRNEIARGGAPLPPAQRGLLDFGPAAPKADVNAALIQDLEDVDSLTPVQKKVSNYEAEAHLDEETRGIVDQDEEHLRGILAKTSVNAKPAKPAKFIDAIPPFYKWDLIKAGADPDTSRWPKHVLERAVEGGPNAPLEVWKPQHAEVKAGRATAGTSMPRKLNNGGTGLDQIIEMIGGNNQIGTNAIEHGNTRWLEPDAGVTDLIDKIFENPDHPVEMVGKEMGDDAQHALEVIDQIGQETGLKNGQIRAAIMATGETPNKIKVRAALQKLDPLGSHEYVQGQKDFEAQAGAAQIDDADIPPGAEGFDPAEFEHMSVKKTGKKPPAKAPAVRPFSRNPEMNAALARIMERTGMSREEVLASGFAARGGPTAERLSGVTEGQIRGLEGEMLSDPTNNGFDPPQAPPAPPPPSRMTPPEPAAPSAARLPEYDRNEFSVERAAVPTKAGVSPLSAYRTVRKAGGSVRDAVVAGIEAKATVAAPDDIFRSQMQTHKSALIAADMPALAETMDKVGFAQPHQLTKAGVAMSELDLLNPTKADFAAVAALHETGTVPAGVDEAKIRKMSSIISGELDRTHQVSTEKDPLGTAKWEPGYYPRTGVASDAVPPKPLAPGEKLLPLDVVAKHRAASLSKERVIDPTSEDAEMFSKPITDKETLYGVLKARARTAGAVMGAASKERTPENYPLLFEALVQDERRKLMNSSKGAATRNKNAPPEKLTGIQVDKAKKAAGDRLLAIQLPDIFEATAKDRPGSTWNDIVSNKHAIEAASAIVQGRDAMDPGTRQTVEGIKSVAAAGQLGMAAPINIAGLSYAPAMAYGAVRDAGGSAVKATGAAFNAMIRALGLTAKATSQDISFALKRKFFGGTELSPSQKEFGPSGTKNPARRAIMVMDRNARKGIADALEPYMQYMRPETLKFIDRGLEGGLAHPRNIEIMRQELSARSQGSGTAADRLKPTGNKAADMARELSLQYSGPSLRQIETALPRLNSPGKAAAFAGGALVAGELVNDMRGVMYGTGLNLPGAQETEDQKKGGVVGNARELVGKDRSPNPLMRAAQNVAVALPGFREAAALPAYGNVPLMGPGAALGGAANVARAISTAFDTQDWRALLSIINAPGMGQEWLKIAKYEAAKRASAKKGSGAVDVGLGQVPQNIGLPFKIQQVLAGKITAAEALRDTVGVGGPTLPIEKRSNRHAAERKKK